MTTNTNLPIEGQAWIGDDGEDGAIENANITVRVEQTDENEIAIHTILSGDDQAHASVYLTVGDAARIAAVLLNTAASA